MWGKSSRLNFLIASTLSHTSAKKAESETVYELVLRIVAFFRILSGEKILQRPCRMKHLTLRRRIIFTTVASMEIIKSFHGIHINIIFPK